MRPVEISKPSTRNMADESVVSDIVTKFFLNTCRLRPKLTKHTVDAATSSYSDADDIRMLTGSVAEFYIEPMLPYVGDIDVMYHLRTEMAIPRGHPLPTQLPDEFHSSVDVYEIIDSHLPGYVYLRKGYIMTECTDDGKYSNIECDGEWYSSNIYDKDRKLKTHGPAFLLESQEPSVVLSTDFVPSVRCLSWPSQAADWPTRHRNYDWPDSATVDCVVSNGCDVVSVSHPGYRQNDPIFDMTGVHQNRLSFSRAEIILINSWVSEQQIIYHMLRFFMKNNGYMCSTDRERTTVSNYHIKTLMLWTSERKPTSWWTENVNLVRICVELLHSLSEWLNTSFPHYFVDNCELVDSWLKVGLIIASLMCIDEAWLSTWFVRNYMGTVCPVVLRLFEDMNNFNNNLRNVASVITEYRLNSSLSDLWSAVKYKKLVLCAEVSGCESLGPTYTSTYLMNATKTCDEDRYFKAVALLYVASETSRHGFSDKLMDVLATILGQFSDTLRSSKQHSSVQYLNKATKLLKVVANKLISITQQIETELSKAYLYRALRCKDSDSDSVYCLANVYLAVLYYTSGQYQRAIDHCILVTRSQDHSHCSLHVVQGELLPRIANTIDSILGLSVFYRHIVSTTLNQQQESQCVSILTTEIFTYYLHHRLLSVTQCCQDTADVCQRYAKYISEMQHMSVSDVLLLKSFDVGLEQNDNDKPERSECGPSAVSEADLNTSELVELLQRSAVEHLTTCRQLEAQDFASVATIVTTDFEALYAYRHGDYQRCLQLSTENALTLMDAKSEETIWIVSVFIQLMDDDIVSLRALIGIVNPKCRGISITQLTLSLYLITQCQLKLHHSVASLFRTLNYIKMAQRKLPVDGTLDHLTLKLAECKITAHIIHDRFYL